MEREKVLTVRDLSITFTTTAGPVQAIRGVNLDLYRGETLAIVGESGSGKSVTVKAAMGILAKNGRVDSGSIEYTYHHDDGTPETVDILKMKKGDIRRHINGKRIAMIFQDPMTSLDPTMPIGKQIMEGMIWHYKTPKAEAYKKAVSLLKEVGITDAEARMKNYPHQLSGGMRQRVVRRSETSPSSILPTIWALWQRLPILSTSCTPDASWKPARQTKSTTPPPTPTPGACSAPCRTWIRMMTGSTPFPVLPRTCCTLSPAMRSRPGMPMR